MSIALFIKMSEEQRNFSHTFLVSESVYEAFQTCSGDKNPLHTDEQFAKAKGFPGRVMYGNILNAFLSYFIGELLPLKEVIIHSQDIAYKNPVFLNDELVFDAVVDEVHESVGVVVFKFVFRNSQNLVIAKGRIQIGVLQ